MSWNHRIIKRTEKINEVSYTYYAVEECYYKKRGDKIPHEWSDKKHMLVGETMDDLMWEYQKIENAFQKPILEVVYHQDGTQSLRELDE